LYARIVSNCLLWRILTASKETTGRQNYISTNIAKSEIVWNEEINVKTRTATENIHHHRMCN
jgi:hypothetical protein